MTRFLTAEWRHLVMANYEMDPALLIPHVPYGTELDSFDGKFYASVVGFMFLNTQVKSLAIPFHKDFEEVNLRFYVRRKVEGEWRRGVVFIKEIVPKPAIAWTARLFYKEKYVYHPMRHRVKEGSSYQAEYEWKHNGKWSRLYASASGEGKPVIAGSVEEFITEHYYGYSSYSDKRSKEYLVEHPSWNCFTADKYELEADVEGLYGKEFAGPLKEEPASVFILDGSETAVYEGVFIN